MTLEEFGLPQHPLDVKPSGNAYTAKKTVQSPFPALSDELLVHILEYLDAKSLALVGGTCKYLRAFSRFDELWKTHCVLSPPNPFKWRGSWFKSFTGKDLASVACQGVFSDTLYRPFLCAHTPLEPYTTNIPKRNEITRLADLTPDEFFDSWTNKPFILTEPVGRWAVYRTWSDRYLEEEYSAAVFRAECVDWPMSTYISYMNSTSDESPLYLFDRAFVEKMNLHTDKDPSDHEQKSGAHRERDFWSPECFGADFFSVLGAQRPDFRWLIVGPERSGSTFHKDPNGTSAWNAVITGSKYWIMFPSGPTDPPPPGVYASEDMSEVTTPTSIAEWFLGFHKQARQVPGCIEGICRAGEILHVPSGWWHLVVNLEPSIALTQNFVPKAHLHKVLTFLRDQKIAISGFRSDVEDPYELFVQRLKERYPSDLEEAMEYLQRSKKRKWEDLVHGNDQNGDGESAGFSFGFGGDIDSDEDVP